VPPERPPGEGPPRGQGPPPDRLPLPGGMRRVGFRAMGTEVSVVGEAATAAALAAEVAGLFERWEQALSRFRPDSELSRLNARAGRPVVVSELLLGALSAALAAARATAGLYDPTLLRTLERLGYDRSFEQVPAEVAAPAGAIAPGGAWRRLRLDERTRTVTVPAGAGVDLGGIGKGLAVDAAVELLRAGGVAAAMVNAGGDLRVLGTPDGLGSWPVAIDGPAGPRTVPLARGALATSGIARRRWRQGDRERHHLLDPRSGLPAQTGLWSVTVVAATCAQAEVAAKTAFILGWRAGAGFLADKGLAGLLATDAGEWRPAGSWPRTGAPPAVEEAQWAAR
jgi:thiamine biosynthesis lipoprotein